MGNKFWVFFGFHSVANFYAVVGDRWLAYAHHDVKIKKWDLSIADWSIVHMEISRNAPG